MRRRELENGLVYYANGVVVKETKNEEGKVTQREMLVRLVYGDEEITDAILEAIVKHTGG